MNNAIKVKELWRDSSGHFAKAPEPVVVVKEAKKEDGSIMIASVVGIPALALWLVVNWRISLPIAIGLVLAWSLFKQMTKEYRALVVNQNGKSTLIKL